MAKSELGNRFDAAWTGLTSTSHDRPTPCGEPGNTVWAITKETPYVPGSLRPAVRTVELLFPDGKVGLINDMQVVFAPQNEVVLANLNIIEQAHQSNK